MRLLMTADAVGGVWTYGLELAEGLAAHGVETTIATLGPPVQAAQKAQAARIPGLDIVETGHGLDWMAKPRELAAMAKSLAALAQSVGADLVHLNSPALAAGGVFRTPVVGACHSCLATWWSAVKQGPMPADFAWRTELLADGYAACNALIAPSGAFADATLAVYGIRPRAVWNGRTPIATGPERDHEREPAAFTAGRLWDQGKGIRTLDAAAALATTPISAAGTLQGPNGERITLKTIEALGSLAPAVLARRLQRTRVFVSPALYEPFGLSVLEAAQAGCALLLSDIPTFRELWDGAAVFTPPGDVKALARALDALVGDPAACDRLAAAARWRAKAYTAAAMAEGTAKIYGSVLPRRARRTAEVVA